MTGVQTCALPICFPVTIDRIKDLDLKYHYKNIYIDDGGVGAGVFDVLLRDEQTRRKVIAINNSARSLDRDETRRKKLLKEDLYSNLLQLMERGQIDLYNDAELIRSLRSVQYEYKDNKLLIYGNYTHITEALIRAAWCTQDRSNNLWVMT